MTTGPGAGSPVDVVAAMVHRAALDGSTCVSAAVVAAALRGHGVGSPGPVAEAAVEAGLLTAYPDERLFGHPRWAPLEEQVAEHLVELRTRSGEGAVTVVDAPRGSAPRPVPDGVVVVEHAHRLGLADATELLARLAGAAGAPRLVLVGDPSMPYAPGPGRVLADLVASRAVPVETAPPASAPDGAGQLVDLVQAVRGGQLPAVDRARREVVVTPAADADEAVRRAVQLVTSSLATVVGLAPEDTLVLAPRAGGAAGAEALRAALDAEGAAAVRTATHLEALEAKPAAVVLVLAAEAAGTITRSMLVGAATGAGRHLSVVHQAGPALAEAVARRPHRPRRTRLATLLADSLA